MCTRPQELVERFVEAEFSRLDHDGSDGVELHEFVEYVHHMSLWMRSELLLDHNQFSIFNLLASRAIEVYLPPTQLPPSGGEEVVVPTATIGDSSEQGAGSRKQGGAHPKPIAVLDTRRFGIRIEVASLYVCMHASK